jgi:hypothetical protein
LNHADIILAELDHTEDYGEFLAFLGQKTPASARKHKKDQSTHERNMEYEHYVCAKYKQLELMFISSTGLSEDKKKNLKKRGILLVFVESSALDPTIFESFECSILYLLASEGLLERYSFGYKSKETK